MRQFFEAYRGQEKVSALLTQLPWTPRPHHASFTARLNRRSVNAPTRRDVPRRRRARGYIDMMYELPVSISYRMSPDRMTKYRMFGFAGSSATAP